MPRAQLRGLFRYLALLHNGSPYGSQLAPTALTALNTQPSSQLAFITQWESLIKGPSPIPATYMYEPETVLIKLLELISKERVSSIVLFNFYDNK